MNYDVVLLRARSAEPGATDALAEAIAARYGVPVRELRMRLAAGSFRVKSNADLETARRYIGDLNQLGAVCEVRDSQTGELRQLAGPGGPGPGPGESGPGPEDEPAGLAAAGGQFHQELGALHGSQLALATLDGEDDHPIPLDLHTPPAGFAALPPAESAANLDLFAPPEAGVAEEELMLAVDPRTPGAAMAPATMAPGDVAPAKTIAGPEPAPASAMASRPPQLVNALAAPAKPTPSAMASLASIREDLAGRGRRAFIAGVAVSALVGLLVAHVVAVFQETSAYAPVRNELHAAYGEATDDDSHAALADIRAGAVDLIESRQRKIAVTGILVWLIVAGAAAALWFRVVPWERLARPLAARR